MSAKTYNISFSSFKNSCDFLRTIASQEFSVVKQKYESEKSLQDIFTSKVRINEMKNSKTFDFSEIALEIEKMSNVKQRFFPATEKNLEQLSLKELSLGGAATLRGKAELLLQSAQEVLSSEEAKDIEEACKKEIAPIQF